MDGIQEQIDTLVKIDNIMEAPVEQKQDSPVSSVETALSEFVKDSFDVTRRDYEFNDKIQEEIAKRLNEFSNSELILLLTNNKVNDSDRLSKMLAPSFQMLRKTGCYSSDRNCRRGQRPSFVGENYER